MPQGAGVACHLNRKDRVMKKLSIAAVLITGAALADMNK